MRIQSCQLIPYRLPFKLAWRTSRGALNIRNGWIIELTTDCGSKGYGDCAPLPSAGTETASAAKTRLTRQLPSLQNTAPIDALESLLLQPEHPAARHALETALLDLISQAENLSLRQWLSPTAGDKVEVNGACGILDEQVFGRATHLLKQGFKVLKLKVGLANVEQELGLLKRLAAQLPADTRLRLDANGAWNRQQAQEFLLGSSELPIESLEEPLAEPHSSWLVELQSMTQISLALDESLPRFSLDKLLEQPPVKRLILKPTVLGGLLAAKKLAELAVQTGLETLVTSTLESSVGIQAAAQLATALTQPGGKRVAHGLATSDWFTTDVAEAPSISNGWLRLPDISGLGVRFTH